MGPRSRAPKGSAILTFPSVARSGQKSLAQGLPWKFPPHALALKGPLAPRNRLRTSEPGSLCIPGPFGAALGAIARSIPNIPNLLGSVRTIS
jgi:hypothetical protein